MVGKAETDAEITDADAASVQSVVDLAGLLRRLRRRQARRRSDTPLSYRELAAKTGWSHSAIGVYLSGQALAPTNRFDVLVQLLGASPAEQHLLATARDRIEESRYTGPGDPSRQALSTRPGPMVPHTLPAPAPYFTGRHAELRTLAALLCTRSTTGGTVVISAIGGTAGVGKTSLAVYWAHSVADRFPDGQLYVNLRGFDPAEQTLDPGEAVRYFLEALQVPPQRMPATLDGQIALYRSLLSGRQMLIVLDNARDTGQVRPLLPGTPGCLVLITSRNELSGLIATGGAYPMTLDLLTAQEAGELLAHRLGHDRVAAEPCSVKEIITHCAGLPLALAIVAARAATNPRTRLSTFAAELRDTHHRWETLRGDDPATDVRAVFSWSYRALSPAAARLFRLLGLHPGPDLTAAAAASVAGVPPAEVGRSLAALARAHLIVDQADGRYTLHDLLRAYAAEQVRNDPEHERQAATLRMFDHYLHSAYAGERQLNEHGDPMPLGEPAPGVSPEQPADPSQALAWFGAEHAVLLAVVNHAGAGGFDTHTSRLARTLVPYLQGHGLWHELIAVGQAALAATERAGDTVARITAHRGLARANINLNKLEDARTHLRHALDLASELGDLIAQAHSRLVLSDVSARHGSYADALDHARHALDLYQAADHPQGEADALNSVGWYHAMLGEYERAITYCERALAVQRELGPGIVEATTWDSLGYAHHQLGNYSRAVTCYERSIDLFISIGDRYCQAETLTRLGDTHLAAAKPETAQEVWHRALAILEDLDNPDADSVRAKLRSAESP